MDNDQPMNHQPGNFPKEPTSNPAPNGKEIQSCLNGNSMEQADLVKDKNAEELKSINGSSDSKTDHGFSPYDVSKAADIQQKESDSVDESMSALTMKASDDLNAVGEAPINGSGGKKGVTDGDNNIGMTWDGFKIPNAPAPELRLKKGGLSKNTGPSDCQDDVLIRFQPLKNTVLKEEASKDKGNCGEEKATEMCSELDEIRNDELDRYLQGALDHVKDVSEAAMEHAKSKGRSIEEKWAVKNSSNDLVAHPVETGRDERLAHYLQGAKGYVKDASGALMKRFDIKKELVAGQNDAENHSGGLLKFDKLLEAAQISACNGLEHEQVKTDNHNINNPLDGFEVFDAIQEREGVPKCQNYAGVQNDNEVSLHTHNDVQSLDSLGHFDSKMARTLDGVATKDQPALDSVGSPSDSESDGEPIDEYKNGGFQGLPFTLPNEPFDPRRENHVEMWSSVEDHILPEDIDTEEHQLSVAINLSLLEFGRQRHANSDDRGGSQEGMSTATWDALIQARIAESDEPASLGVVSNTPSPSNEKRKIVILKPISFENDPYKIVEMPPEDPSWTIENEMKSIPLVKDLVIPMRFKEGLNLSDACKRAIETIDWFIDPAIGEKSGIDGFFCLPCFRYHKCEFPHDPVATILRERWRQEELGGTEVTIKTMTMLLERIIKEQLGDVSSPDDDQPPSYEECTKSGTKSSEVDDMEFANAIKQHEIEMAMEETQKESTPAVQIQYSNDNANSHTEELSATEEDHPMRSETPENADSEPAPAFKQTSRSVKGDKNGFRAPTIGMVATSIEPKLKINENQERAELQDGEPKPKRPRENDCCQILVLEKPSSSHENLLEKMADDFVN